LPTVAARLIQRKFVASMIFPWLIEMRDTRIQAESSRGSSLLHRLSSPHTMLLSELQNGAHAVVASLVARSPEIDAATLRRLSELGFIAGEPVQLLRRGPGGREPLAVLIGETMFGLRRLEAECVEVVPV
jgi:ferrous iron transport protein A